MPAPCSGPAVAAIGTQLYVNGCQATTALDVYDPATNTWSVAQPSATARSYAGAVTINGKMYVFGGCVGSDCDAQVTGALEVYDPVAGAWTTKMPMPTPRNAMAFGAIGGLIYVAGGQANGYVPQAVLEVYDPVADAWTTKTPMSTALRSLAGAVVNGALYATGGNSGGAGSATIVATVNVYDPSTDMWTSSTTMPVPRTGQCSAAVNGLLYTVGGASGNVAPDGLTYGYDPGTSMWSSLAAAPMGIANTGCASIGSTLFVVGPSTPNGELYAYTPP